MSDEQSDWWYCPTCRGKGRVPLSPEILAERAKNPSGYIFSYKDDPCQDCDGNGLTVPAQEITSIRDEVKNIQRDVSEIKSILERHFNNSGSHGY